MARNRKIWKNCKHNGKICSLAYSYQQWSTLRSYIINNRFARIVIAWTYTASNLTKDNSQEWEWTFHTGPFGRLDRAEGGIAGWKYMKEDNLVLLIHLWCMDYCIEHILLRWYIFTLCDCRDGKIFYFHAPYTALTSLQFNYFIPYCPVMT